jgi:hypothetical protein
MSVFIISILNQFIIFLELIEEAMAELELKRLEEMNRRREKIEQR